MIAFFVIDLNGAVLMRFRNCSLKFSSLAFVNIVRLILMCFRPVINNNLLNITQLFSRISLLNGSDGFRLLIVSNFLYLDR